MGQFAKTTKRNMKLLSLTVCVLLIAAVSCTHNKERREKNKERKEKKGSKEKKNDNGGNQNNGGGCGIKYYTVQETEYQTSCSNTYKTQCSTSYKTQCSTSYKTVCNQVPQITIQNQCTQQHIQEPGQSICTNQIKEVCSVVAGHKQECYQDNGQQSCSQSAGSTKVVESCTPVQQTSHRQECHQSPQEVCNQIPQEVCNQIPQETCSQQPVAVNKQVARRVCY